LDEVSDGDGTSSESEAEDDLEINILPNQMQIDINEEIILPHIADAPIVESSDAETSSGESESEEDIENIPNKDHDNSIQLNKENAKAELPDIADAPIVESSDAETSSGESESEEDIEKNANNSNEIKLMTGDVSRISNNGSAAKSLNDKADEEDSSDTLNQIDIEKNGLSIKPELLPIAYTVLMDEPLEVSSCTTESDEDIEGNEDKIGMLDNVTLKSGEYKDHKDEHSDECHIILNTQLLVQQVENSESTPLQEKKYSIYFSSDNEISNLPPNDEAESINNPLINSIHPNASHSPNLKMNSDIIYHLKSKNVSFKRRRTLDDCVIVEEIVENVQPEDQHVLNGSSSDEVESSDSEHEKSDVILAGRKRRRRSALKSLFMSCSRVSNSEKVTS
jgi:hypothetical protein